VAPRGRVWADDERRVPLPTSKPASAAAAASALAAGAASTWRRARGLRLWRRRTARRVSRCRSNRRALTCSQVEPLQRSLLRLRVDDVGVLGIDASLETVAASAVAPLARPD